MQVKECRRCHEVKPYNSFYLKAKSPDGLQDYCKDCQNEYNKMRVQKERKNQRLALLKALSNYKQRYGLDYSFLEPKMYHKQRNKISYRCLVCGKEVISTIKDAYENKFTCDDCNIVSIRKFKKPSDLVQQIPEPQQETQQQEYNEEEYNADVKALDVLLKAFVEKYPFITIRMELKPTKECEDECECGHCHCEEDLEIDKPTLWQKIKNLFQRK